MFEREEGLRANMVAKFKICPSDSCGSCRGGGEYIVELRDFVETYQEAIQESQEAECETNKEACEYNCENGVDYSSYASGYGNDDDYCLNACLASKGASFCIENEGDDAQQEIDMQEFGECRPMNEEDENNNYGSSYEVFYTGAYCTSSGVYAGVFTDATCSKQAPKGTYEKYNYGYSLPTEPLVSNDCISCASYNNDDANNAGGVSEVCAELYEQAVKCEKNVKATYTDTSGCEMIHKVIPKLSKAMKNLQGKPTASTVFAWIFGLGFFGLAAYLYRLHKKTGVALDIPGTEYTLE